MIRSLEIPLRARDLRRSGAEVILSTEQPAKLLPVNRERGLNMGGEN
jgi:hypothetical protein